jgi:hypothetical protein
LPRGAAHDLARARGVLEERQAAEASREARPRWQPVRECLFLSDLDATLGRLVGGISGDVVARQCMFCGGDGRRSREHVIPQWFSALLPPGARVDIGSGRERGPARHSRTQTGIQIITKAVCEDCNTGWMSELEAKAQAILTPAMLGQRTRFQRADLDLIALWAAKTALAYAMTSPDVRDAVTDGMPRVLYETRCPPPLSGVWMGTYCGTFGKLQVAKIMPRKLTLQIVGTGREVAAFDWTAAIGHVVFKVVFWPEALWNDVGRIEFGEPKPLVPVWATPWIDHVDWPAGDGYHEAELIALSFALVGKQVEMKHLPPNA